MLFNDHHTCFLRCDLWFFKLCRKRWFISDTASNDPTRDPSIRGQRHVSTADTNWKCHINMEIPASLCDPMGKNHFFASYFFSDVFNWCRPGINAAKRTNSYDDQNFSACRPCFPINKPQASLGPESFVSSSNNQLSATNLKIALTVGLCGLWLGLIVIDAAIFLLLGLVYFAGLSLEKAVPIKSALIFISSIPTICVFILSGDINWHYGEVLSLGSIAGAILGSSLVLKEGSGKWIHGLLILVVSIEAVKIFL